MRPTLILLAAAVGLAACKPAAKARQEEAGLVAARAASAVPADARLAGLYRASCQNCHGHPDSGAPATAYHYAWDERWAQGMPALLSHAIGGYKGMPAGGQCFACTQDDLKSLIRFMAAQPADAN